MSKFILSLSFLFILFSGFSQENNRSYTLFINGDVQLSNPAESLKELRKDPTVIIGKDLYLLVQFSQIPTAPQKEALVEKGITLLHYIPNYAWIAKIDSLTPTSVYAESGVRGISRIESSWKFPLDMTTASSEELDVRILFWDQPSEGSIADLFVKMGIVSRSSTESWVDANITQDQLQTLAGHPLVQYIEWTESTPIEEGILDQTERAISTYISNNPGKAYYFDGSGVRIAVEEGGIVDTLQNPNFRSRIDRTNESVTNVSGHKTGVALRMASAGNIDPKEQGTAFGAEIYSGGMNFANAATSLITIINRSIGWGCPSGPETYNSTSENYDNLAYSNPTFTITHSAGNIGGSTCYADTSNWGNITGVPKMAKNIFIVGSTNSSGNLTGFSSRGPAKDGRVLPTVVAPGDGGTSHASPNLAGVFAQLNEAYRHHNSGNIPQAGLLKAILMNTADDMENPGPDFRTGYGSINARRAYDVIREDQILVSSITQSGTNNHSISVPSNVAQLRVMIYWTDYPATPGITTKALVNDMDMTVTDPNSQSHLPWVLNPALNSATLNDWAVQATDTLNNVEQVTINNPTSGTYNLSIIGTVIPQGPQNYFITYEYVYDDVIITHPHGGEKFVPGETERIRWDAYDTLNTFDLSYSLNDGATWTSITTGINPKERFYDWIVPQAITNQAKIRIEKNTILGESDTTFTIYNQPQNLQLVWTCADSSLFFWDEQTGADGYVVYRIVGDYMDSIAYTTSNSIVLNGLSLSEIEYVSVAALENGITSRRVIALERLPSDSNCVFNDVGVLGINNPSTENIASCMLSANDALVVDIRNWAVNSLDTIPMAYQLNNDPVVLDTLFSTVHSGDVFPFQFSSTLNLVTGANSITVWTALPGDIDNSNDTLTHDVILYTSSGISTTLSEDFDGFTTCSTAWGCETIVCPMENDWYNVPNLSGDDIDWRTNSGGTGTGGTGPSGDHTTGSGNYLYLEGSGNGGSGCLNNTAKLYSPCVDLTNINSAQLSFWYHAYGGGIGEIHVDVISNGQLIEDVMPPVIGNQGDQWTNALADLSPFAGEQIVVVIRGSTGGGFAADLAIDDINISVAPVADFQSNETQLCNGETAILNNNSVFADSYDWTFTPSNIIYLNGTDNTSANPEVLFGGGSYDIQLIANNAFGSDTLIYTDYIYVWNTAPTLSPVTDYCAGDSVIIQGNNDGQAIDYYMNGMLMNSGTASEHFYDLAQDGDTLYALYPVNSTCTLYSDTLIINMTSVDTTVTSTDITLTAINSNASNFQWIDCNNGNSPIAGATNAIFTASTNGSYAVIVTENGCIDTSACHVINQVNLETLSENDGIHIHPNPTHGEFSITFETTQNVVEVIVTNSVGQIISREVHGETKKIQSTINTPPGIYFISIEADGSQLITPIVKL